MRAGAASGGWGRPGPPPAACRPRTHRADPRTPYRPPVASPSGSGSHGPRRRRTTWRPSGGQRSGGGDQRAAGVRVHHVWRSGSSFFGRLFSRTPKCSSSTSRCGVWRNCTGTPSPLQGAARDMLSALYAATSRSSSCTAATAVSSLHR